LNMSNILSLSKARKAKARTAKEEQAAQNRVLFGRTKAEREMESAKTKLAERALDGHRLTPTSPDKRK
jgi:hypothetical protein